MTGGSTLEQAPGSLRVRMQELLAAHAGRADAEALTRAAFAALQHAAEDPRGRHAALDLLSADALLTHACAAAAELGEAELAAFTDHLDAHHFQQLADE